MKYSKTNIEGLLILEPVVHQDDRGYFFESFRQDFWRHLGIPKDFVQENQAFSTFGALRGLHLQTGEYAQSKLVRVTQGEVLDVVVDLRVGSTTYGLSFSIRLSAENHLQMYIPRGFAHGYVVLSNTAIFQYKCDNYYNKGAESGLRYDDPDLSIDWILSKDQLVISEKDRLLPLLSEFHTLTP